MAIQICHWIANPLNRQFVVSRFPRVVRSQKITVPAKSTDFSNCFRLNPQCSSHSWVMMMVEPSWETALAKGQLPLFAMIMGQSTCNWWCDESSDMRKKHRKQRVFLSKLVNWMITGHIFGLSIETLDASVYTTHITRQCPKNASWSYSGVKLKWQWTFTNPWSCTFAGMCSRQAFCFVLIHAKMIDW